LTGITRNPWNPAKTTGGSSGGAAAAVATGIGPIAVAGDGGGSIRMPGSFTGVYGIKGTAGRVAVMPGNTLNLLTCPGPMSRTVADSALMFRVACLPDDRDPFATPYPDVDWVGLLDRGVGGLKIGYSADFGYVDVDPEIRKVVADAVRVFESLGAVVEDAAPPFPNPRWALDIIWKTNMAVTLRSIPAERIGWMDPDLVDCARAGLEISAMDYHASQRERLALNECMRKFHQKYDLLVTPQMPLVAFDAGLTTPDVKKYPRWYDWSPFTWPFNMSRQPAAVCPAGFNNAGLPIGMQIVGALHREDLVLRASAAFEKARPFKMPRT
jgi:aspartyl-tRNA(Asn)/glutamyl-tRNA(Gln) amidotransferase subunit A